MGPTPVCRSAIPARILARLEKVNIVDQPWLSVIVPVRNGEKYLDYALQSILSQGDDGIEVIAVEGGSTDQTVDILKSYMSRLPLKLFSSGHSENWVAKTNRGLANAAADFVCFLHHDDLWLENRLRVMRALVERAPDATMFLHPSWFIDPRGKRVGMWRCPFSNAVELGPELLVERLLVQNFISIPAPIFSRAQALRVGGLDEALWYTADWDFWLKLAATGKTVYHPRALTAFRIHPHAQTMQGSSDIADFRRQLEIVLERHIGDHGARRALDSKVQRVARFSIEVNTGLATLVHGGGSNLLHLFSGFSRLGPTGWHRYLRDSRILERTLSRYRIGLASYQKDSHGATSSMNSG
jgi:glycosyltransferase involved in cell wall biosynthesis